MVTAFNKLPLNSRRAGVGLVVLGVSLGLIFLGLHLVTGGGVGVRSFPRAVSSLVRAVQDQGTVRDAGTDAFTNVIFLHHSTGEGLIRQGDVRELFTQAGYAFWDHGFNIHGLRDPEGNFTGYDYLVPRDNTDPAGLFHIFAQPAYAWPLDTFSALLQHDVIILKSCFSPGNDLTSDQQIEAYQRGYGLMRDRMARYPNQVFILMTTPPLNPAETTPEVAARARQMAAWLTSAEFAGQAPNLFVFDYYSALADNEVGASDYGMLRADYRNGDDSHPNRLANITLGPALVEFVINAIETYRAATAR